MQAWVCVCVGGVEVCVGTCVYLGVGVQVWALVWVCVCVGGVQVRVGACDYLGAFQHLGLFVINRSLS